MTQETIFCAMSLVLQMVVHHACLENIASSSNFTLSINVLHLGDKCQHQPFYSNKESVFSTISSVEMNHDSYAAQTCKNFNS